MDHLRLQLELDGLAGELGRGVSVDDPDGGLIAYSAEHEDADLVRVAAILTRKVPAAVRVWQQSRGIEAAIEPVRLPANAELGMSARWCVPVVDGPTRLGFLWILEDAAALTAAEQDLARASAHRVGQLIRAGAHPSALSRDRDADRLFAALLDGSAGAAARCEQLLAAIGSPPGTTFRITTALVAQATGRATAGAADRPLTDVALALRKAPSVRALWTRRDRVEILADAVARDAQPVLGTVATTAEASLVLGSSEPFQLDPGALARAATQATEAAECAALDPALPRELEWSALKLYLQLLPDADPMAVLAPLDPSSASGAMLLLTLETYLDLGGDAQHTSAQLNVHRTSLYYRLGRIAQLLRLDLTDGLVRTQLHVALKQRRLAARSSLGADQTR
jgi:PucR family transcriptional regulator, proline-responsive transcriptional activator